MMRAVSVERADPLQWCHNGRDCVSNHQPHDCLLNRIFRRRSKKSSKFHVTDVSVGNQWASNVENVSIWRCHHALDGRANDKCLSQAIIEKREIRYMYDGYFRKRYNQWLQIGYYCRYTFAYRLPYNMPHMRNEVEDYARFKGWYSLGLNYWIHVWQYCDLRKKLIEWSLFFANSLQGQMHSSLMWALCRYMNYWVTVVANVWYRCGVTWPINWRSIWW